MTIDTTFDFREDAGGKDPDSHSPTLREYHRLLWSKPLPNGDQFTLRAIDGGAYLSHDSGRGKLSLSSDSVMQTFIRWKSMQAIVSQLTPEENAEFQRITYTIGGMIIFPSNRVDGKQTINGARGTNRKISDRFDLTLECIRRFYTGEASPLSEVFGRYSEFFALFDDFRGYVEFFLLQDLIDEASQVKFFTDFDDFKSPATPKTIDAYQEFRVRSIAFVEARNRRIESLGL